MGRADIEDWSYLCPPPPSYLEHARAGLLVAAVMISPASADAGIVGTSCTVQADNDMRYDCIVTTEAPSTSWRIGVRIAGAGFAWRWYPWQDSADYTRVLWDFQPGETYEYRVQTDDLDATTATLGTPDLPSGLHDLDLSLDGALDGSGKADFDTRYILLDTSDCGSKEYLIAVNLFRKVNTGGGLVPYIAWYQDLEDASGITGADSRGLEVVGNSGEDGMLVVINLTDVFWWDWRGAELRHKDYSANCSGAAGDLGPCPHHAAFNATTGETYVVTAGLDTSVTPSGTWSACTDSAFVDDGLEVLDSSWSSVLRSATLMADYPDTPYDPSVYEGPNPPDSCDSLYYPPGLFDPAYTGEIDWTHANAVYAYTTSGVDFALVSLKDFNEIALLTDPPLVSGEADWVINGMDGALRPHGSGNALSLTKAAGIDGEAEFSDQHDVRTANGLIQFLDNNAEGVHPDPSRVLRLDLDPAGGTAEIVASFVLTDRGGTAQDCPSQGSARVVPGSSGDRVLALCQDQRMVMELDDATGDPIAPAQMTLTGSCPSGVKPGGWYRALPLKNLGGL